MYLSAFWLRSWESIFSCKVEANFRHIAPQELLKLVKDALLQGFGQFMTCLHFMGGGRYPPLKLAVPVVYINRYVLLMYFPMIDPSTP